MAHGFCSVLYQETKQRAIELGIKIPRKMTALRSFKDQWFIESPDLEEGVWCEGDCATNAKSDFLQKLIDKKEEEQEK